MSGLIFIRKILTCFFCLFVISLVPSLGSAQTIGDEYPQWQPGVLEIHQISTGKGDAAFFIFPDGTTMLVDAGATASEKPRVTSVKPNASHTPGQWIARYIRHMLAFKKKIELDYFVLTHFHGDHLGDITKDSKMSGNGAYKLSGITEVGDLIPIHKVLDRGWPDYNYPRPIENDMVNNYRSFLKWQMENNGMQVERFKPGRNDQIVLLNEREKYPDFEVRNVAANGEVWTGVANNTRHNFPPLENVRPEDYPNENICSCAIRLSYGKFDYFTGGDLQGFPFAGCPAWHDVETPIAKAIGPVEVNVLNHHGCPYSENDFFLSTLRPRVHIFSVWSPLHPGVRVLDRLLSTRLYPGPRDIFATGLMEATRIVIGRYIEKLKSNRGHIVVRVDPGGDQYKVFVLDDSAETYKITGIFGPYTSN